MFDSYFGPTDAINASEPTKAICPLLSSPTVTSKAISYLIITIIRQLSEEEVN